MHIYTDRHEKLEKFMANSQKCDKSAPCGSNSLGIQNRLILLDTISATPNNPNKFQVTLHFKVK